MNIAGLGCGMVLDFFRVRLRHGFNIASLPADSLLNSGSRLLLACALPARAAVPCAFAAWPGVHTQVSTFALHACFGKPADA